VDTIIDELSIIIINFQSVQTQNKKSKTLFLNKLRLFLIGLLKLLNVNITTSVFSLSLSLQYFDTRMSNLF
jgi:hypothetical protein